MKKIWLVCVMTLTTLALTFLSSCNRDGLNPRRAVGAYDISFMYATLDREFYSVLVFLDNGSVYAVNTDGKIEAAGSYLFINHDRFKVYFNEEHSRSWPETSTWVAVDGGVLVESSLMGIMENRVPDALLEIIPDEMSSRYIYREGYLTIYEYGKCFRRGLGGWAEEMDKLWAEEMDKLQDQRKKGARSPPD